jgi:alpha-glucoside transport system substrate-binding protein
LQKQIGEIMANATNFGFDASQLMPAEVGQGAEPAQLALWMSGATTLPQALTDIAAAWPAAR